MLNGWEFQLVDLDMLVDIAHEITNEIGKNGSRVGKAIMNKK